MFQGREVCRVCAESWVSSGHREKGTSGGSLFSHWCWTSLDLALPPPVPFPAGQLTEASRVHLPPSIPSLDDSGREKW